MKNFVKGKLVTALVVVATIILAGVAIFTALRLYQLRQESVSPGSPESEPAAWDCSKYTFTVAANGVVTVNNQSTRDEPLQKADVYINGNKVATFDVPALPQGQSATIGTVQTPSGGFNWKVVGTKDCQSSGSAAVSCELLTFTITQNTPTVTPTGSLTPTQSPTPTATPKPTSSPSPSPTLPPGQTPTPTDNPIGGGDTPTPTPTVSPSVSPTNTPTSSGQIQATSPSPTPGGDALPNAGSGILTIAGFGVGILLITFALLLAI